MPSAAPQNARKRRYRSVRREQRAHETQQRILAAASAEFVRSGYSATTMRAVASAAGVSVATVELAFGTKPQLLRAAISFAIRGDAERVPMLEREWAARAQAAESVADFLAIVERVLAEAAQRSAGLVAAAFEAAHVDESIRALADQLRAQRAETAAWIVDGLKMRSPLRPEIGRDQAIDTVWLLMDPHGFCALTRHRGWTPERFGRWFTDSVRRLILAPVDAEPTVPRVRTSSPAQRSTNTRTPRRHNA
jgi:TetR/AcrR family transcriptional regulator, regulator of autoinduction and epiphytic fitness